MIKDINLIHSTSPYHWDWDFGLNDLNSVTGDNRLRTMIKHAVLLKYNELRQELYQYKGSDVYDSVKSKNTALGYELIIESAKLAILSVDGIKDVELTSDTPNSTLPNLKAVVITEDNREVVLDVF